MKFRVDIKGELVRVYEVEADNCEEAHVKFKNKEGKVVLGYSHVDTISAIDLEEIYPFIERDYGRRE
jgi:hypothetical protein